MRALLDASFLIPLLDSKHTFNKRAQKWWGAARRQGWSSCPITENAVLRVMSNPGYDRAHRFPITDVAEQFRLFCNETDHQFWPDGISILEPSIFETNKILGYRQLTDVYLLALATANRGRLVTFDQGISISAVRTAKPENLVIV